LTRIATYITDTAGDLTLNDGYYLKYPCKKNSQNLKELNPLRYLVVILVACVAIFRSKFRGVNF